MELILFSKRNSRMIWKFHMSICQGIVLLVEGTQRFSAAQKWGFQTHSHLSWLLENNKIEPRGSRCLSCSSSSSFRYYWATILSLLRAKCLMMTCPNYAQRHAKESNNEGSNQPRSTFRALYDGTTVGPQAEIGKILLLWFLCKNWNFHMCW